MYSRIIVLCICATANCFVHRASNARRRGVTREIWCQTEFALFKWRKCFMFYDSACSRAHEVNMPVN